MDRAAQLGGVFTITIDDARFGIGQIAGDWRKEIYIVFHEAFTGAADEDDGIVGTARPIIAALSLDVKIHNGDWLVIGNRTDKQTNIPQPSHKAQRDGRLLIEPRDRSASREASLGEIEAVIVRTAFAPSRLPKALQAWHGVGALEARYDERKADYAYESSKLTQA